MSKPTPSLHGNAPDKCDVALPLIHVVNDLEFAEGDQLLRNPLPMAEKITLLKEKAARGSVPIIDVNDNFGRW